MCLSTELLVNCRMLKKRALINLAKQVIRLLEIKKIGNRYEAFFESTSDMIYELDSDGKYLYLNKAAQELLGYSAEELRNMVCWDFIPQEYKNATRKYYLDKIRNQQKSAYYEFPVMNKDKELVWLGQSVDYEFDKSGKAIRAYAIAKDMTEIKRSHQETR